MYWYYCKFYDYDYDEYYYDWVCEINMRRSYKLIDCKWEDNGE